MPHAWPNRYLTGEGVAMGFLNFLSGVANVAVYVVLTDNALKGDRTAIAELVNWHFHNDDRDGAQMWRDVFNRDAAAMFDLGLELKDSAYPDRRACAVYWFAQAQARGHPLAAQMLRALGG